MEQNITSKPIQAQSTQEELEFPTEPALNMMKRGNLVAVETLLAGRDTWEKTLVGEKSEVHCQINKLEDGVYQVARVETFSKENNPISETPRVVEDIFKIDPEDGTVFSLEQKGKIAMPDESGVIRLGDASADRQLFKILGKNFCHEDGKALSPDNNDLVG